MPTLAVIIATYKRPQDLHLCLQSVALQTQKPSLVMVVDGTNSIAGQTAALAILKPASIPLTYLPSSPGLTHQRNVGIDACPSDYILFLDDDTVLQPGYIANLLAVLTAPGVAGATGYVKNEAPYKSLPNLFRKLFMLPVNGKGEIRASGFNNNNARQNLTRIGTVGWLSGCNMAYPTAVLKQIRCDESFLVGGGEDVDLSVRASALGKLVYQPAAVLNHNVSPKARHGMAQRRLRKVLYHWYKFNKNIPQTFCNKAAFCWSLLGLALQALIFERSLAAVAGVVSGLWRLPRIKTAAQLIKAITVKPTAGSDKPA